ncbi:hypothetical protein SHKM778_36270 [Streptomyces sp. KM77-8]|uniref:Secreted protein n=1 Tax=Streptomyces haneummycinicus TaxID=3074435 RepID=A0AAT9HJB7_9ACTN
MASAFLPLLPCALAAGSAGPLSSSCPLRPALISIRKKAPNVAPSLAYQRHAGRTHTATMAAIITRKPSGKSVALSRATRASRPSRAGVVRHQGRDRGGVVWYGFTGALWSPVSRVDRAGPGLTTFNSGDGAGVTGAPISVCRVGAWRTESVR